MLVVKKIQLFIPYLLLLTAVITITYFLITDRERTGQTCNLVLKGGYFGVYLFEGDEKDEWESGLKSRTEWLTRQPFKPVLLCDLITEMPLHKEIDDLKLHSKGQTS